MQLLPAGTPANGTEQRGPGVAALPSQHPTPTHPLTHSLAGPPVQPWARQLPLTARMGGRTRLLLTSTATAGKFGSAWVVVCVNRVPGIKGTKSDCDRWTVGAVGGLLGSGQEVSCRCWRTHERTHRHVANDWAGLLLGLASDPAEPLLVALASPLHPQTVPQLPDEQSGAGRLACVANSPCPTLRPT